MHTRSRVLNALILVPWLCGAVTASPLFLETFDSYPVVKANFRDTIPYVLRKDSFGLAAVVKNTDSTKIINIEHALNPDSIRGAKLLLSGWTKADGLTKPPAFWNGVKVQITMSDSNGQSTSSQLSCPSKSSWGWTRSTFIVSVPSNLQDARLTFGLERAAGTARFDSISIVRLSQSAIPPRDTSIPIPPATKVRLRGATTWNWQDKVDPKDIETFATSWKGNLFRWHMNAPGYRDSGLLSSKFDTYLAAELVKLDSALPICRKNKIKLVVLLQTLSEGLFHDAAAQSRLIRTWKYIANRYKNEPAIWGWDIANEPIEDDWHQGLLFWDDLADTISRTIRSVDTSKAIIVESTNAANVSALANLKPVGWKRGFDIKNVVYSFHFYEPGYLTHQGVIPTYPIGPSYPGTIGAEYWDKARLRKALAPAFDFQKRYRVPIYVGEFSCVRWAPQSSAYNWLKDFTEILEETDWNWTYHSYNEYQAWNPELSTDRNDSTTILETARKKLLTAVFSKNTDPYPNMKSLQQATDTHISLRRAASGGFYVSNVPTGSQLSLRRLDGRASSQSLQMVDNNWHIPELDRGMWLVSVRNSDSNKALRFVVP